MTKDLSKKQSFGIEPTRDFAKQIFIIFCSRNISCARELFKFSFITGYQKTDWLICSNISIDNTRSNLSIKRVQHFNVVWLKYKRIWHTAVNLKSQRPWHHLWRPPSWLDSVLWRVNRCDIFVCDCCSRRLHGTWGISTLTESFIVRSIDLGSKLRRRKSQSAYSCQIKT